MKSGESTNKIASYLQAHISGDVLHGPTTKKAYATDGSILTIEPSIVVHPRTTNDIRKTARFAWQLAEKGHVLPITARGSGTDTSGAAIGKGIIVNTTAHMGKILEIDTKQRLVRVQPGLNFKSLQETLHTHGLFLPAYPANYKYSTIGGAIANNAAGEKSFKYGSMIDWVEKLEVVLANGEIIQTGKISKKELQRKKGLPSLEGEIYRAVDGIVADHEEAIYDYDDNRRSALARDNVGFNISDVFRKDGSCDLTPLFVGSQGTLGIITEAILKVAPYSPQTSVLVATFDSFETMADAVEAVVPFEPSSIEMIDAGLLEFTRQHKGINPLKRIFEETESLPAAVLFVECDDDHPRKRNKKIKKMYKILQKTATDLRATDDLEAQEELWSVRNSTSALLTLDKTHAAALPIIDDCIVPPSKLLALIDVIQEISKTYKVDLPMWGHVGDAHLHVMPVLDLAKLGDRQKIFKIMKDYFAAVVGLGGSIAAENNDGRLRSVFSYMQLGDELTEVNLALKKAFDPHAMLNPGVKTGTDVKQLVDLLRDKYTLEKHLQYLPRL